jgi:uncharacterized protein YndB with AHSA1/START domain
VTVAYDSLSISEVIPAPAERIYAAWLSSDEHTAFTGDKAFVEPFVGGKHSTFDGYASGQTVELQPGRRIVQTWRAEDFPIGSPDSRVEVTLEETLGGTMVTILHTEIPPGQGSSYRDGWLKYYLEPLKGYFVASPAKGTNGVPHHAPKVKAKAAPAVTAATKKGAPKARKPKRAKVAAKLRRAPKARVKAKARSTKKSGARPAKKRVAPKSTKKRAKKKARR